jgi:hypothetical protein
MFDYISPITQYISDMQMEYENGVLKAVHNVGFHVDKEELAKALAYDRGQYDKGYEDGSADVDLLINEFCVPLEVGNICEELHDFDMDEDYETWCSRNCGVINDGTCPSAECYKAWLRMKKGE